MLRKIVDQRVRVKRVIIPSAKYGTYTRRGKYFLVNLECQHVLKVPFSRHPIIGMRLNCKECEDV